MFKCIWREYIYEKRRKRAFTKILIVVLGGNAEFYIALYGFLFLFFK